MTGTVQDNPDENKYELIFTIGHSNHSTEVFFNLLTMHSIDVLVDTRSHPFSKYSVQFNYDELKKSIADTGKKYLYLGRELGGMPKDPTFYDQEGHVLYWKIATSREFQTGIERLLTGIRSYRVALMCAEEDPSNCHRRLLIARVLREHDIQVRHIRADGALQTEQDIDLETPTEQLSIFLPHREDKQWRSTLSVSRKKPLLSSSNH